MLYNSRDFIVLAKTDSVTIKTLLTDFNRTKEKKNMVYNGYAYTVWKTEIDLKVSDRQTVDRNPAYK